MYLYYFIVSQSFKNIYRAVNYKTKFNFQCYHGDSLDEEFDCNEHCELSSKFIYSK